MLAILKTTLLSALLLSWSADGAACRRPRCASVGKAIYFLTNDAQNAVVALPIAEDGTLSGGTVTSTGGAGSNSIDGAKNATAAPDAPYGGMSTTDVAAVTTRPISDT